MVLSIDELIRSLMAEGWNKHEAIRRAQEEIKERKKNVYKNNLPYENKFRQSMQRYNR